MTDFYLAIGVAVVIILITFLLSRRLKKAVNVVLLIGISESGKTALFSRIIFNKPKKTVTSLSLNEAIVSDLNIHLVDLPGADRYRNRCYELYRDKARHIVVVIDSTTFRTKLREVSEHLYMVLSDSANYKNQTRITIACHKQDIDGAPGAEIIAPILEKELCAIRNTRAGQLAKTSNDESEDHLAKFKTKELTFANLGVKLVETSISNVENLIKTIF